MSNKDIDIKGKKLLILGGNALSCDIVKTAREMGVYTIVTDWNTPEKSPAKLISDDFWNISISDHQSLSLKITEEHIDGIFTSFTDSYLLHYQHLCEKNGFPYYGSKEAFEQAIDKDKFKRLCNKYDIPTVPEYDIKSFDPTTLSKENAIIIKPVDNSGARGITYCDNVDDYSQSLESAKRFSPSNHIIIEKFIKNGGTSMSIRYIAVDGQLYLQAVGDRYVLNDFEGKALITAAAFYPSKHTNEYILSLDNKVKKMFKDIGVINGALFIESFWTPKGIFFYEMGLRLSGGQTYKLTEKVTGINELKMLIRFALTGKMCDVKDISKIDAYLNGYTTGSITIPLRKGTITRISGLEEIEQIPQVQAISMLRRKGETIKNEDLGTLFQLLARISIVATNQETLKDIMFSILNKLSVKDEKGNEMFISTKLEDICKDYMS